MSWAVIARLDLEGSWTERGTVLLFAGFLLGLAGLAALIPYVGDPDFEGYLFLVRTGSGVIAPLAGIVLGYETVVGERETGTAVLSLSLPHSRADMVLGKLAGRTALLAGLVGAAGAVAGLILLFWYPAFEAGRYLGLLVLIAAYATVFLWLSCGLSMALSSSRRVITAAFGAYIGLTLVWSVAIDVLVLVLFRFRTPAEPESWATFSIFIGPYTSFNYLLAELLDVGVFPPVAVSPAPEFVTPLVAVCALIGWAVGPVIAGYLRFRRGDL